jgi:toxin CcdB
MRPDGDYASFPGLTPVVEIGGQRWIVRLQELATVSDTELGMRVGGLAGYRDDLRRGLDILIDGF